MKLQEMNSRVHRATSSAPEIDHVLRATQADPFTEQIRRFPLRDLGKLVMPKYGGFTDPSQHLTSFGISVRRARFSPEEYDAGCCQLFVENLEGDAIRWFSSLKPNSIDNFHQLSTTFLKHYSMFIKPKASAADLWTLAQGPKETLRQFVERFKNVASQVAISDEAALPALRNALWYESSFRDDLKINKPQTLEDALHRASVFIEIEEEKVAMNKKHAVLKVVVTKEKERESDEPRQHYNKEYADRKARGELGKKQSYYVTQQRNREQLPWNKMVRGQEREPSKYCQFHKQAGHSTEECRQLASLLMKKFQQGEVEMPVREGLRHQGEEGNSSRQSQEKFVAQTAKLPPPPMEKRSHSPDDEDPPAPVTRRRVSMIMGGLKNCSDSVRSIKEGERRAVNSQKWKLHVEESLKYDNMPITFTDADTFGVDYPHNDPLVIELMIADCEVSRIMVDTGSTVNIIFKESLRRMGLKDYEVKPSLKPLTGFNGESEYALGSIKLPVYVGRVSKLIKFLVLDRPAIYNVILGTSWLHTMRAIPSTYHQCLKFPTKYGVFTVRGNQRVSRSCFIAEHRLRKAAQACLMVRPAIEETTSSSDMPTLEVTTKVNIDRADLSRCVSIGAELQAEIRDALISFLTKNSTTFAWSTADMTGIDPTIASHELNVDPTFKPVKQKRRKLGPERTKAVNDDVERLKKSNAIVEVKYPDWLSNPVVVKKKNGKWRVCVDFTDLNKACPKDSYPLPSIDRLVESTSGNELLSFMDAFSGYNQILMHPDDQEKTAFITERGIYCYRVMPFGLKNAGATYQRLVNRMFADQLGDTMEVYIDDMLVKSFKASDHIKHLEACFEILNKYNMKLNPAKCTFGVQSGEFLGYLVTKRGIEANPRQIKAIEALPSPRTVREVQRLTGRIAALNRFISRSTDRCLPFYQLLRGNKRFEWDLKCEQAFAELKKYLSTPPVLSKPEDGETLYLYIAISSWAVSSVLVREDRGEQKPIFYTSKSLNGSEARYSTLEKLALAVVTSARKLRPYFQSHAIVVLTNQPLKTILHSPNLSGRIAKWAVELSEYDIEFRCRTSAKSQVLADFLIELPEEFIPEGSEKWNLYVDGSSSQHGSGVGVRIVTPDNELIEQSFRLAFPASNNEAEYEAVIAGLRLAKAIGAKHIQVYCDSQLVANQYSGEYDAKNERMDAYLKIVRGLSAEFATFSLTKIPRSENSSADALATLASSSDPAVRRTIPVETIDQPSIQLSKGTCLMVSEFQETEQDQVLDKGDEQGQMVEQQPPQGEGVTPQSRTSEEQDDWRTEILLYLEDGDLPPCRWAARRLKARSAQYCHLDGNLYRKSASGVLLHCVDKEEAWRIMMETHEGAGGNHSGGRALAHKIKSQGFYWPTMVKDCEQHAAKCEKCQRHGPMINTPTEPMSLQATPYPFMRWAMDIIGPLPRSRQKEYILVMTDYFSKWVEAKAYSRIKAGDVQKFVWQNIICRHGLPYEIVTDNGSQFVSEQFEDFCAKWKIRLNKSTPRYPQGNGQAEATNRRILDGLKKRLETKKGLWADELDGVLWSLRTTPRTSTGRTPFAMSHGLEAMAPAEVSVPSLRRTLLAHNPGINNQMLQDDLDYAEGMRDQALLRMQNYQQRAAKYYNKKVRGRCFYEGDLVLRRVFENTAERPISKLGANWEGPYIISKVVRPGVYELLQMDGDKVKHSWNAVHLKRYFY